MDTAVTLGGRIKKQDPEAFELLQNVIGRPGMFVGKIRFDYVEHFFAGYHTGRGDGFESWFLPGNQLEYWLLHTQSVALDGSLGGEGLFYRYFGLEETSFKKYREFLNAPISEDSKSVNIELSDYDKNSKEIHYRDTFYEEGEDVPPDNSLILAQGTVAAIKKMIDRADLTYEKLKIYIRRESSFNQIRFMLYGKNGWSDDREIIAIPENHELLIEMHAKARATTTEALRECGCDVVDAQHWFDPPSGDMYTEYLRWKECITAS
ncbi:MAG: hypothetical protein FWH04_04450 [Oscillospiraceae bacterium]|nr:hypothetical protein [Oscillospiraceae bacterium]